MYFLLITVFPDCRNFKAIYFFYFMGAVLPISTLDEQEAEFQDRNIFFRLGGYYSQSAARGTLKPADRVKP